jgi:hypothetical protein
VGQTFGARWSLIVGGALTVLGILGSVLYFSRRRGFPIGQRLLPRPSPEVQPQTDPLVDAKRVVVDPQAA